jgi:hypothetical protein
MQFRTTHNLNFNRVLFRYSAYVLLREMPTIVHFEIPADDIDRAKKFYFILTCLAGKLKNGLVRRIYQADQSI